MSRKRIQKPSKSVKVATAKGNEIKFIKFEQETMTKFVIV